MPRSRLAVLALLLSTTPVACGPGGLVPQTTVAPSSVDNAVDLGSQIPLGVELASVRGQSLVAVEPDQRHQRPEALLAVERAREYVQMMESLAGGDAQPELARLSRAIDDAAERLRPDGAGALRDALAAAGTATLQIESEVVGEASGLAAYKASVVSGLVGEAAVLYESAVERLFDPEEYRKAYGLLREAENIHEGLATVLEENTNDNARAADTLLAAMFGAMPSSNPPIRLLPAGEVAAYAYLLGVLLADNHGAVATPSRSLAPPVLYLPPLLEEVLGSYESGEAGVADVLLEKVRASLCCAATSVGDALETELVRLSNAIRSGAAHSDVATLVERSSELASDAT